jgi:3-oxoacyl-[acyl-carrier-protein] synthase II
LQALLGGFVKLQSNNPNIHRSDTRVVITGLGAITPVGHTALETWQALKAGRSGVVSLTVLDAADFPCKVGGELSGFEPDRYLSKKMIRQMPHASQIAVIATRQALEDANLVLEKEDRDRIGVVIGTAGGSTIDETEAACMRMIAGESTRTSPFQAIRLWPNMTSYFVAEFCQVRGYNSTICTACASATQAIGEAAEVIRRGAADVVITGGSDSLVSRVTFAGFNAMRALPTNYNDEPERASRPFDARREGFVPALGCGILILESLAHARQRGARILAEVLGLGVSNDGYHMIVPDPSGEGASLAIKQALVSSRVGLEEVDYINAHGTGTPLGDLAETNAIKSVFGERAYQIPISATKSMTGHMMGAAGAVEAIACVMSIQEGIIHPTINYDFPDPACDLDYVPNQARVASVRIALSNSFGLGGQNASLVLGAV